MSYLYKSRFRSALSIFVFSLCLADSVARGEPADDAALLAPVLSPAAPLHEQAVALEELALHGGPASAAELGRLLDDARLSHYARYALQSNPAPEAGEELRCALERLHGDHLIGVINSVASRCDEQAAGSLARLITSKEEAVAVAAAGALATIGSDTTLAALEAVPQEKTEALADALLQAASVYEQRDNLKRALKLLDRLLDENETPRQIKQAATLALLRILPHDLAGPRLTGLLESELEWEFLVGLQAAVQAGGSDFAEELAAALRRISPDRQARVLSVLPLKRKGIQIAAVRAAAGSPHANVRAAAAAALGTLGDGTDGPLLVGLALDDPVSKAAAIDSLVSMKDDRLDDYLIGMLHSPEAKQQILSADVIGLRHTLLAVPKLFEVVHEVQSDEVRLAALGALRRIAPGASLGPMLDLVRDAHVPDEERLAREAALEVALRSVDPKAAVAAVSERLDKWPADKCNVLFDVLARIGDDESLQLAAKAADSSDREIQNQATRVLGAWPSAQAGPVLIRLASSEHPYAVRSLRGYLRIARQYKSGEERLEMCRRALEIASRDEERILALQILSLTPTPESLRLAATQLKSDSLGALAGGIVVSMAEKLASTHSDAISEAVEAVMNAGCDKEVITRATKLIDSR